MPSENASGTGNKLARAISIGFHPLLMPLYGMMILFSAPTLLGYLPFPIKKIIFLLLLTNNVFVPLSLLPFFRLRGMISSYSINERKERTVPLLINSLLYAITAFIFLRFQIPFFIKSFIFATFFLTLAATIINFWYKISIHSIAAGALTALVLILSVRMYVPLTYYLAGVIIVSGLILSSRLQLNRHTPSQVFTGYLAGLAGMAGVVLIF